MAFTNTPKESTYRNVTVKFDDTPTLRSPDPAVRRDSHIINLYYDRVSQENKEREVSLKKRPGLAATTTSLNKVASTDVVRGYFYDEDSDIYYWVVKDKAYYLQPSVSAVAVLMFTLGTTTGDVGFASFAKSTGEVYTLMSDGVTLHQQRIRPTIAAMAAVVDPDLPTPHTPCISVLDGYVFLSKGNTLYNSDNDTFDAWTAGNDIDCEMSSDDIRYHYQNKNYIVAIGYNSLEIFWDAANATGSPLSRNDSGFKSIGYIDGYACSGDQHFFVGQEKGSLPAVYMNENFKVEKISNEVVERTIQSRFTTQYATDYVDDIICRIISVDGHDFYCIGNSNISWYYDFREKMWFEWRTSTDTAFIIEAAFSKFQGGQYVIVKGGTTIDFLSPLVYNDKGVNFTCSYTTQDNLFGSANWKVCNRISLVCDRHAASGTSNLIIQWSDNDWADGPTGSQTVNVFSNMPIARRCGRFRNRSFRLLYTDNYPIRMKSLELEINIGAH